MKIRIEHLNTIDPITVNQRLAHEAWKKDNHNMVLSGCPGTGKTFTALYLALEQVLDKGTPYESVHIFRSLVPSRDAGFLPGTIEEKFEPYLEPYKAICNEIFSLPSGQKIINLWESLILEGIIQVHTTSYIRGTTFDNSIMLVDEMQNMSGSELNTLATRTGQDTRVIYCGDYFQSDLKEKHGRRDILDFLKILEAMCYFSLIEFTEADIVRSGFVRDYIITKKSLNIGNNW